MRAGQHLRRGKPGATLLLDRFDQLLAVAPGDRIADVDHQRLGGERLGVLAADLLDRGVGHHQQHHIGEIDGLLHGACLGVRPGAGDEVVQLLGVPGGEHDRMAGLGEQRPECAALASGADRGDLQRTAARPGLGQRGERACRQSGERGGAAGEAEDVAAARMIEELGWHGCSCWFRRSPGLYAAAGPRVHDFAGARAGTRTCSGRNPMPTSRAGMRRKKGM